MRISVVTACYNQEKTVHETINSILSQRFSDLQYIFIDGASTDSTLEIARSFSKEIDVLISEPDAGQYHAIQKGFEHANGEIMAWLNGDDIYHPWTLSIVEEIFEENPNIDWIIGLPTFMNKKGQCTRVSNDVAAFPKEWIKNGWYRSHLAGYLQQESMFWRKSLWDKTNGLDLSLSLAADFELWTQFAKHAELVAVSVPLAAFRVALGEQRSSIGRADYDSEVLSVCEPLNKPSFLWNSIANFGVVWRSLCRFLVWKKGMFIAFSEDKNTWILNNSYRPISRISWAGLLLEQKIKTK